MASVGYWEVSIARSGTIPSTAILTMVGVAGIRLASVSDSAGGGGPYWNNCWGMNTWYRLRRLSPPGTVPIGVGLWWLGRRLREVATGMVTMQALYDAGRYNGGYGRGAVNYGPRGLQERL